MHLTFTTLTCYATGSLIVWYDGSEPVRVGCDTQVDMVVGTAMDMFSSDMEAVTGNPTRTAKPAKATIRLVQLDRAPKACMERLRKAGVPVERLDTLTDGFNITVDGNQILVTGSNGRGTAYGLLELSRLAGVSPWIWWGDVIPGRRESLSLPADFSDTQGASVEYRGIFINDEDWSLRPWSCGNFEPNDNGTIGPRTYREVFRLLMRLRANAVWPAMHPGTEAFFRNPENKRVADSCGIAIGSSHCEPLLRNNVGEWNMTERGRFNYITNRRAVQDYWTERLREVKDSEGGNMFTIGMRGIHDGSMEGVKTLEEKFSALQQVIDDQQQLIFANVGDPSAQMQVFVPYKEVLELYEMGLQVPDYVTLMWCDDNYGYITRLSSSEEAKRSGGGGVYYHMSYWGRPHDYLWLTTTQPGLIYNEMRNVYDHNVRRLWIGNVHDPKVAAYDLQLFLDMAWDIDAIDGAALGAHLEKWLCDNFGEKAGKGLYPVMRKYYELTAKRRPEFMGWSQTELDRRLYQRGLSPVANTEFSFTEFGGEAERYMEEYMNLAAAVDSMEAYIPERLKDAYFAAVKYPVAAAAGNAVKMLEAQRARSIASGSEMAGGDPERPELCIAAARSQNAYQNVRRLTHYYNKVMSGGKWNGLMNMRPRDLPAVSAPSLPLMLTDEEVVSWLDRSEASQYHALVQNGVIARNACDYDGKEGGIKVTDMLGHSMKAISLEPGSSLIYSFTVPDSVTFCTLTTAMIPTQPVEGGDLRYRVSIDGGEPVVHNLKEPFRSEQWKLNVLRGQALRTQELPPLMPGEHSLTITAIDPHIVADQWIIDTNPRRSYYLVPVDSEQ